MRPSAPWTSTPRSRSRKEDAARLLPVVHDHLETCTQCCDAYEALLDVLVKASPPPETEEKQSP